MKILKNKLFIIAFICFITFAILGIGVVIVIKAKSESTEPTNISSNEEMDTVSEKQENKIEEEVNKNAEEEKKVEEQKDPYADWKTYTNTKYSLDFIYPPDWIVQEVDVEYGKEIRLKKQDHIFVVFVQTTPTSPDNCNYPDTPEDPNSPPGGSTISDYKEIVGDNGVYRRHIYTDIDKDYDIYSVCKKLDDGSFITWIDGSFVTYRIPKGKENQTILNELDNILKKY